MKFDPFDQQLLIDYDLFCRKNGAFPFQDYMVRWYEVTALIEEAQEEGRDPFSLTVAELGPPALPD